MSCVPNELSHRGVNPLGELSPYLRAVLLCIIYPFETMPVTQKEAIDYLKIVFGVSDTEFAEALEYLTSRDAEMAVKEELRARRKSLMAHRFYNKNTFKDETRYSLWMVNANETLDQMLKQAGLEGGDTKKSMDTTPEYDSLLEAPSSLSKAARVLFESLRYLNHHWFFTKLVVMVEATELLMSKRKPVYKQGQQSPSSSPSNESDDAVLPVRI